MRHAGSPLDGGGVPKAAVDAAPRTMPDVPFDLEEVARPWQPRV